MEKHKKKDLNPTQFNMCLLIFAAILLLCMAGLTYVIDPFYHFHDSWIGPRVQDKNMWMVNGTVRNFDYDSLVVGSSTCMNTDLSILATNYEITPIKAVANSAMVDTLVYYIDEAYENHDLKYVFWSLDAFSLSEKDTLEGALEKEVLYLADDNPFNDIKYLLNLDILLEEIPRRLYRAFITGYNENRSYAFAIEADTNKNVVFSNYVRPGKSDMQKVSKKVKKIINNNLDQIKTVVEAHPETNFVFYFPVYSILNWDSYEQKGILDIYLFSWEKAVNELAKYGNVSFVDVGAASRELVLNLDYFCDHIHAGYELSDIMFWNLSGQNQEIKQLDDTNIAEYIEKIRLYIADFEERVEQESGMAFLLE